MAESKTSVCNLALARLGGRRINDFDDNSESNLESIYCRLFFEETAKALLKDHYWPFAKTRVQLSQTTTPAWQYDYAYLLPTDFLRVVCVYNGADNILGRTENSYEIEGKTLLTDEDEIYLKYIKYVDDVGAWDALFTEVFILVLAKKLVIPLSQDVKIKMDLDRDLAILLPKVRAMDRQEEFVEGRQDLRPWKEGRSSDTA